MVETDRSESDNNSIEEGKIDGMAGTTTKSIRGSKSPPSEEMIKKWHVLSLSKQLTKHFTDDFVRDIVNDRQDALMREGTATDMTKTRISKSVEWKILNLFTQMVRTRAQDDKKLAKVERIAERLGKHHHESGRT